MRPVSKGCHLTQLPKPFWSKFKRTLSLREDGSGEILAWIAGKKDGLVVLRDPSGLREVRVEGRHAGKLASLPLESLVWIKGVLREGSLIVEDIAVINKPIVERRVDYIAGKPGPREFAESYYWYVRREEFWKTVFLRNRFLKYARELLEERGFIEIEAPMVGVASDPGLRGARKLWTQAYGFKLELTSSVIMYKQLMASVFEKIYYIARNVREEPLENSGSGRHLFEFTQLDLEWSLSSMEDVMRLAEDLIYYSHKRILEDSPDVLPERIRDLNLLKPPYPVITYSDAVKKAREMGFNEEWGRELSVEAETALSKEFEKPFWLAFFPQASRGFYYYPVEGDEKLNMDFNLILPWGFGEALDGGCREYRYERLVERIKRLGEDVGKYKWFLDLALNGGIAPSCGWGLGLERFIRFLLGLDHVVYVTLHPRLPGVLPP